MNNAFGTDTVAKPLSGESSSTNYVTCQCHMLASLPMTLGMTYTICGVFAVKIMSYISHSCKRLNAHIYVFMSIALTLMWVSEAIIACGFRILKI